jgi:hypothetical protein
MQRRAALTRHTSVSLLTQRCSVTSQLPSTGHRSDISTAGILRLAAAAVSFGLVIFAARAQNQATNPPPADPHHVTFIASSDALFDSTLDQDFPAVSGTTDYQKVRPLLAILKNDGTVAVNVFVVKWVITNPDGTATNHFLPILGTMPARQPLAGEDTALRPRSIQLVTPRNNTSSVEVRRLTQGPSSLSPLGITFQDLALHEITTTAQPPATVQISLDGVLFADGMLAGPDTWDLFDKLQSEQRAAIDEAAKVLSLLHTDPPLTPQGRLDQLSEQTYAGYNATGSDPASLYIAALGRHAKMYLALAKWPGQAQAELARMAEQLANANAMTIQRFDMK